MSKSWVKCRSIRGADGVEEAIASLSPSQSGADQIVIDRNRRMITARITIVRVPSTGFP
jgi:hypothetical protein